MKLSLIVAASENNVIGRDNDLPWSLPDDLAFFRRTTEGHPIIMGRKNHESIGRALPKRTNVVVTRQKDYESEGCIVVHSIDAAIAKAKEIAGADAKDEIFVIGGAALYEETLPFADRIYLTRVHAEIDGDVYFPPLDESVWELQSAEEHAADERHAYPFTIQIWEKR